MTNERLYTSRRNSIVTAIADSLKRIDGTGEYLSNVYNNVEPKLLFWDEIPEFPAIHLNAGSESREYQGGGLKDRYLAITIRIYVEEENATIALSNMIEDVETVLELNETLSYTDKQGRPCRMRQISIIQIDTDEGVLEPLGVGEILIEVQY